MYSFRKKISSEKKQIDLDFQGVKVLLIDGGSRQVLPMIKGFHELGCWVAVYCQNKLDVGYVSKYTDCRIIEVFNTDDPQATYAGILKTVKNRAFDLIVPMNDFAAGLLAANKEELSQFTKVYVNNWDIYKIACDKLATMSTCMKNSIPCPRTALIDSIEEFDDSHWKYPLVIKPRVSYGANGFGIVKNKTELLDKFKLTEKKFGPSLIQEYIRRGGRQYQVEMVMDALGECKAILIMDKVRWYPLDGGSSTMNITIHDEKIKNSCISLLKEIGWRGYASLDLIEDPDDGVAKILEINPRINGTAKICFFCGVNLSQMILQDVFDKNMSDFTVYKDGNGLRYFHMDVLWFFKSPERFRTIPSWFSIKNTIDEIFDWQDMKPAVAYSITALKKLLKDKKKRSI